MSRRSGMRQVSFSKSDICLEWTPAEQAILLRGLLKYASKPVLYRCLNISNELPNKRIRDVACRTRWVYEKVNESRKQGHNLTSQGKNEKGIDYSGKGQSEYDEILSRALRGPYRVVLEKIESTMNVIRTNLAQSKINGNLTLLSQVAVDFMMIESRIGVNLLH